jgi:hypothetical protein
MTHSFAPPHFEAAEVHCEIKLVSFWNPRFLSSRVWTPVLTASNADNTSMEDSSIDAAFLEYSPSESHALFVRLEA